MDPRNYEEVDTNAPVDLYGFGERLLDRAHRLARRLENHIRQLQGGYDPNDTDEMPALPEDMQNRLGVS